MGSPWKGSIFILRKGMLIRHDLDDALLIPARGRSSTTTLELYILRLHMSSTGSFYGSKATLLYS